VGMCAACLPGWRVGKLAGVMGGRLALVLTRWLTHTVLYTLLHTGGGGVQVAAGGGTDTRTVVAVVVVADHIRCACHQRSQAPPTHTFPLCTNLNPRCLCYMTAPPETRYGRARMLDSHLVTRNPTISISTTHNTQHTTRHSYTNKN
jgi:hypothetical protein